MTNEEKKQYIIRNWNISSGKRITEMLKRYYLSAYKKDNSLEETAVKIFGGKLE